MGEEVHVLIAGADVWPGNIETLLNKGLLIELVSSPPSSGDEVPSIIGGVDNGASEGVDTK